MKEALWARIGVSFNVSDEKYEILAQAEGNNKKIEKILETFLSEGKAVIDGDCYFPDGCHPFGSGEYEFELFPLKASSFKKPGELKDWRVYIKSCFTRDAQAYLGSFPEEGDIFDETEEENWRDVCGSIVIAEFKNISLEDAKRRIKKMYPGAEEEIFIFEERS